MHVGHMLEISLTKGSRHSLNTEGRRDCRLWTLMEVADQPKGELNRLMHPVTFSSLITFYASIANTSGSGTTGLSLPNGNECVWNNISIGQRRRQH